MLNICIIGKGSIGKKHAKIFKKLGHKVSFFRSLVIKKRINSKEIYNYKKLSLLNFNLYVICNPTSHHFSSIKKILKKNINIFVEKPLVSSFNELKKLKNYYQKYKLNLFTGYVLRHDPRVVFIKKKKNKYLKKV